MPFKRPFKKPYFPLTIASRMGKAGTIEGAGRKLWYLVELLNLGVFVACGYLRQWSVHRNKNSSIVLNQDLSN